jgi:hypothetical protein
MSTLLHVKHSAVVYLRRSTSTHAGVLIAEAHDGNRPCAGAIPTQPRRVVVKPLFIPLKSEFFDAFACGDKTDELRLYGLRWNERTCTLGRSVLLSRGYGRKHRLFGRVRAFKRQHGTTFGSTYRESIERIYGTLDVWIACIGIELQPDESSQSSGAVATL